MDNDIDDEIIYDKTNLLINNCKNEVHKSFKERHILLHLIPIFICVGASLSIIGPTLPCLEILTESREDQTSLVFTGRAVGGLGGWLLALLLLGGLPVAVSPHALVGFGTCVLGLVSCIIPWPRHVWWLMPVFALQGGAISVIQTGGYVIIRSTFPNKVTPYRNLLLFALAFGSVISPTLVVPFFPNLSLNSPTSIAHPAIRDNVSSANLQRIKRDVTLQNVTPELTHFTTAVTDSLNSLSSSVTPPITTTKSSPLSNNVSVLTSTTTSSISTNVQHTTSKPFEGTNTSQSSVLVTTLPYNISDVMPPVTTPEKKPPIVSKKPTVTNGNLMDSKLADGSETGKKIQQINKNVRLEKIKKEKTESVPQESKTSPTPSVVDGNNTTIFPSPTTAFSKNTSSDFLNTSNSISNISSDVLPNNSNNKTDLDFPLQNQTTTVLPTAILSVNKTENISLISQTTPYIINATILTSKTTLPPVTSTTSPSSNKLVTPTLSSTTAKTTPATITIAPIKTTPASINVVTANNQQKQIDKSSISTTSSPTTLSSTASISTVNHLYSLSPTRKPTDTIPTSDISNTLFNSTIRRFDNLRPVQKIYILLGGLTWIVALIWSPVFICRTWSCFRKSTGGRSSGRTQLDAIVDQWDRWPQDVLFDGGRSGGLHQWAANVSVLQALGLLVLVLLSALYTGMEVAFGGFLYSFAVRYLLWSKLNALFLTMLFWASFCLGRLSSFTRCWRPSYILFLHLAITLFASLLMITAANTANFALYHWLSAALFGIGLSSVTPALHAFLDALSRPYVGSASQLTLAATTGSFIGEMLIPVLVGYLHRITTSPRVLVYALVFCSLLAIICFVTVFILGRWGHLMQRETSWALGRSPPHFEYEEEGPEEAEEYRMTPVVNNASNNSRGGQKWSKSTTYAPPSENGKRKKSRIRGAYKKENVDDDLSRENLLDSEYINGNSPTDEEDEELGL